MSIPELLLRLKNNDIHLDLAGDDIEVNFDGEDLPTDFHQEITWTTSGRLLLS